MNIHLEGSFDRVFDTQRIYRLLLEACARPGKILALPEVPLNPPTGLTAFCAAIAFTLCDQETTFALLPGDQAAGYLTLNTGAEPACVDHAGFIFAQANAHLDGLELACRGDLLSPENGATVVLMVEDVTSRDTGETVVSLSGPGVDGNRRFGVSGLSRSNLDLIKDLNREFPLGVDTFIVDGLGKMVSIPRSSSITWEVA